MAGLNDGLGYEELGQAGSQVASLHMTGSIVANSTISGSNLFGTGSVITPVASLTHVGATTGSITTVVATTAKENLNYIATAGSPYSAGVILQLNARSNITGGQWVCGSGNLAYAAVGQSPIGVARATVASGGTVDVIVRGVAPMVAEGTIAVGERVAVGAGGALNCVVAYANSSGAGFSALSSAASGGTVFILL